MIGEDHEEVIYPPHAEEGDLPDWLSDLSGEETSVPEEAVPTQASVPAFTADDEEELPDWLSSEDEQETESASPATESDLPDWISELSRRRNNWRPGRRRGNYLYPKKHPPLKNNASLYV